MILYAKKMISLKIIKIQEVIKKGQIMLAQVTKIERGNKGASFTTHLSLPGQYSVLMPNTKGTIGVSHKISSYAERKRLKKIVDGLEVSQNMSLIVRTAGENKRKTDIKKDFNYLNSLWSNIRDTTLNANAPAIIHQQDCLIKHIFFDISDIGEIIVNNNETYAKLLKITKNSFPDMHKKITYFDTNDTYISLFSKYKINDQVQLLYSPEVALKSGGSIVIAQTEALIAIDVNSGKSTVSRNVQETAFHTNLEAAQEIAKQIMLRDLGGLIVIDFIDMENNQENLTVEKKIKELLKKDKARIQFAAINQFGLLTISRQRINPSFFDLMFDKM